MMILIIDNYDSFTYNLYQYVGTLNPDVKVVRNDAVTVDEIRKMHPDAIILSPGPGKPCDAGICEEVLREMKGEVPILGVCLGHQAIGEVFGGKVTLAPQIVHGKKDKIHIDTSVPIFKSLGPVIEGARYHSLIVDKKGLPPELEITAETEKGEIMGLKHRDYDIYGLQFHPESIMTPDGMTIIRNFINLKK
jgi:anthranilate synthase component 2